MSIDLSNFQKRINRVDTSIRNEFDLALIGDLFHALSAPPPGDGALREVVREMNGLALILRGEGSPEHSEDLRRLADRVFEAALGRPAQTQGDAPVPAYPASGEEST